MKKLSQRRHRVTPSLITILFNNSIMLINLYHLISLGYEIQHITSFLQLVYTITTIYYFLFLFTSNSPKLFTLIVSYGNILVNGGIWLNYWLIHPENRPNQLIQINVIVPQFFLLGNQAILWQPIIFWWFFQFLNRNQISLLIWEFEAILSQSKYFKFYYLYYILCPSLFPLTWYLLRSNQGTGPNSIFFTDLPNLPNFFTLLIYSSFISTGMFCWYSLLTFQYRAILWRVPNFSGYLVVRDENVLDLYELY